MVTANIVEVRVTWKSGREIKLCLRNVGYNGLEELKTKTYSTIKTEGTRQAMYVHRNIQVRKYKHCCKAWYSYCLLVSLGIEHAMRKRLIIICDLYGSTIYFHSIS
jgi:hypothetical protein